ncbi:MAG TPA: hypothetical protein VKC56_12795 [Gallionellaceae bacterium]|nr:hypothetical protein [Gallionellaceae bacterium]
MTIKGSENIRDIFSIFHDGHIESFATEERGLLLAVRVQYLAQRINPLFRRFFVRLAVVEDIHFSTWPSDLKSVPAVLRDVNAIFKPELEILEGNVSEGEIKVVCNQPAPGFDYCGGELYFRAASAEVTDEAGKSYTIDELDSLCNAYWEEWASRTARRKNGQQA